jgi:membrane-bound lytic murein transglycosylase
MKALKLGLTVLPFVLLTACASQQTAQMAPVDEMATLKASVQQAIDAASSAQSSADAANATSAEALSAANAAQSTANAAQTAVDECCAKIDRMFEKTMQK